MTTSTPDDRKRPRRRVAIGPRRPQYLHEVELDRLMMVVTALAAEVSALRERLDTHELLAVRGTAPTHAAVEAHVVEADDAARREAARMAYLKRVFRILTEELDAVDEQARGLAPAPAASPTPDPWEPS